MPTTSTIDSPPVPGSRPPLHPLSLVLLFMIGCADVEHRPVPYHFEGKGDRDECAKGVRYYEPALFLLVYSDGKGGAVTRILTLPDQTRKMEASASAFLGNLETTLKFENGMLTSAEEVADTTAVPSAVIKAVETIAGVIASAAMGRREEAEEAEFVLPPPELYKIVVTGDTVSFIGGPGSEPISVTLKPEN